jgi:hypothetical protein
VYNAFRAKNDLAQAFVQMKLTVLQDPERLDEVVHLISLYANSQTKIAFSDFSANDPFHVEIEKLSRQVWAPNLQGKATTMWFYERARGQYLDERSRQDTPSKRKTWEIQHPPRQKLTKSLVAKYEMTWRQRPDWVSEGAEKNFARFSAWLQENPIQVDRLYFEELVAKAIVFRECDAVVKSLDFGGYKANVVAYTVAWLSYITGSSFDMDRVWQTQTVSESTRDLLRRLAQRTFDHITSPPGRIRNISEWCKKEECWLKLRDQPALIGDLMSELRGAARRPAAGESDGVAFSPAQSLQFQEAVISMSARQWFGLGRWIRDRKDFATWDKNFVANCGVRISRGMPITAAQLPHALRIFMQASAEGYALDDL